MHYLVCPDSKNGIISGCPFFNDKSEWVHLPCKTGDTIYQTDGVKIYEGVISKVNVLRKHIFYHTNDIIFGEMAIGKSIFLTRKEAEKALKECKE